MSNYNSEKVKAWRIRNKSRIIEAMGGSCVCCGYNRCPDSLELHHIDPTKKDFGIGSRRANPANWQKIFEERKCILLCSNCHKEIHAGYSKLPDNPTPFSLLDEHTYNFFKSR